MTIKEKLKLYCSIVETLKKIIKEKLKHPGTAAPASKAIKVTVQDYAHLHRSITPVPKYSSSSSSSASSNSPSLPGGLIDRVM